MSNNKYFSKMYIWLHNYCAPIRLCSVCLAHARICFAWLSNIYRWKIYLWHVSYALRKTQRLKCLNCTDIFAVCYGGSIWSMIDIKGCLRISVHKLVRLCEFNLSFMDRFSPFVRLFQVRFSTLIPAFIIFTQQRWWENALETQFREEKSVTDY